MTEAKLRTLRDAVRWRRTQRGTVVVTNGVFELLHPGHVTLLEAARALGTALIVGVNGDRSAPRLGKGRGRPCVSAADRAHVLAGLAAVDCIVLFEEDTPAALIAALAPDVLVKGDDYDAATLPGRESVLAAGGRVVTLPRLAGYSTTSLMERIRATS
ncbi:MAG TPA: adenylyltransferase/cytidyltransferase family protein [Gemmatimonadales bacterium]|nr:adenylyltransferase/cytidyltransferase family protein [Gemmatimonadales bacterium]